MTLAEMYAAACAELVELDAYRLRLLGRAAALRELLEAGLGHTDIPEQKGGAGTNDAEVGG
jgi:hypothetical protein